MPTIILTIGFIVFGVNAPAGATLTFLGFATAVLQFATAIIECRTAIANKQ